LAREVTTLVHGNGATQRAERISQALFYGEFRDLSEEELREGFHDVPTCHLDKSESPLVDLLVACGASPSKRQSRQDIQSGAIYLNGERCTELERVVRKADGLHGRYVIVRRGKKNYYLVD
jgi:tyrosyl-tRNA synthetase